MVSHQLSDPKTPLHKNYGNNNNNTTQPAAFQSTSDTYPNANANVNVNVNVNVVPKSSPKSNANKANKTTMVQFTNLTVRVYNRILGDNPSCSNGPSLSIGWEYTTQLLHCPIDDYESSRYYTRRLDHEMVLSRKERESILMDLGYTQMDIASAVRANIKTKNQRRRTIHNLAFSKVEEAMEKVRRKVKKTVKGKVLKKKLHLDKNNSASFSSSALMRMTSGVALGGVGGGVGVVVGGVGVGGGGGSVSQSDSHLSSGSSYTTRESSIKSDIVPSIDGDGEERDIDISNLQELDAIVESPNTLSKLAALEIKNEQ